MMSRHSGRKGRISSNGWSDSGAREGVEPAISTAHSLSSCRPAKTTLSLKPKAEGKFEDEKSGHSAARQSAMPCSPQSSSLQPASSSERTYLDALTGRPHSPTVTPFHVTGYARESRQVEKVDSRFADMEASFAGSLQLQELHRRQLFLRAEAAARGALSDRESVVSDNASFVSFESPRDQRRVLPLQERGPLHPIDAHGEQFFPITSAGPSSLPIPRSADFVRTVYHVLGIGIEAEFLLRPLVRRDRSSDIKVFADKVAENHNRLLLHSDARFMESHVSTYPVRSEHDCWTLIDDSIRAKGPASK